VIIQVYLSFWMPIFRKGSAKILIEIPWKCRFYKIVLNAILVGIDYS